ncbi:MAG: SpoIID/LytB domain-containing protein [Nitrospirae bacterium]|nr:SpoIID/LytB domain-containing protein [Nitrospirota bacterium]
MRILLANGSNPVLPVFDEKVEMLSRSKGEAVLGGAKYPGIIEVWRGKNGLYTINEIPLELYIRGVVASEIGENWDVEAVKAQAVTARTYAVYQKNVASNPIGYHLTSTILHQVYKGNVYNENIERAVNSTKDEILTYKGEPIIAYYHSTSADMTEDPIDAFGKSYPYLKPVKIGCDLSPYCIWEKRIQVSELEGASKISGIRRIAVNSYTATKRAWYLRIDAGSEIHYVIAKDLRRNLGWDKLPSTMLTSITRDGDYFIFQGKGYGHGVGMCQWCAFEMARAGLKYKEILSRFYTGTEIQIIGAQAHPSGNKPINSKPNENSRF